MTDQTAVPPVPGVVDLHARLAAGETLYGAFAGLGSPVATEIMARSGFDWLIIDLEHGAGTEADLLASLHAMGATPAAALVRPQSGERLRIGRALDLGAHGIMVPRVDLPEQAREAISFMRYPPDGTRGLALSTRGAGLGEQGHTQIQAVNRRILGIIQIESRSAVDHSAEIAAIDGVDVLFVGPTDLSHSLGIPGRFDDPVYLDALRQVATTAEAAGKVAGILLRDAPSWPPRAPDTRTRERHRQSSAGASASSGIAGSGAPRGRGDVWATTTLTMISAAPTSWIGSSRWPSTSQASVTMIAGSTVLSKAA
jgi:4-hydroxy-2-oxoheptanedioate aldolase